MSDPKKHTRNVLLLGASGKIGLEIRKALAQSPAYHVICCSRQAWQGPRFSHETWLKFDPFADAWSFPSPIDVVINAVGAISETKSLPFAQIHLGLTQLILQHRAQLGHARIVQVSALGADATHETAFLRTKGQADALLLQQDDVCVLRPSIVCTPATMLSQKLQQLLKMARFSFGKLLVPSGFPSTQIQPILGEDVGWAVAKAAFSVDCPSLVELVGPQRISFGALIAEMAAAQSREVRLLEVSREIMETFVKHFVAVWFPDLINHDQFKLLFVDNVGDMQQTAALLGRNPADTIPFWKGEAGSCEHQEKPELFPRADKVELV